METRPPNPDDAFLDHTLRSGIKRTSREFEANFNRIRFQSQDVKRSSRIHNLPEWRPLFQWATLGAAAVLTLLAWFYLAPASDESYVFDWTESPVYLEDPFYWDEAFESARVILEDDMFEAIVFLSHEDFDR